MQRWTREANRTWDELFTPTAAQGRLYNAQKRLDHIETDPSVVAAGAYGTVEVRHENYPELQVFRTPVEAGPPPLAIHWVIQNSNHSLILTFEA